MDESKIKRLVLMCLVVLLASVTSAAAEATMYSVFCANGKIEVDMRSLDQMKSARGSDVCMFGQFSTLSSAQDLARKQFGGEGASCTCGK